MKRLEAGGLTLEQSLELWERGERLADICQEWLEGARARLTAATAQAGDERPRDPMLARRSERGPRHDGQQLPRAASRRCRSRPNRPAHTLGPHARPDRNLALELARVTEAGAMAAARWVGRGDKNGADGAAVQAMRR